MQERCTMRTVIRAATLMCCVLAVSAWKNDFRSLYVYVRDFPARAVVNRANVSVRWACLAYPTSWPRCDRAQRHR